jgi:hypothetical protein
MASNVAKVPKKLTFFKVNNIVIALGVTVNSSRVPCITARSLNLLAEEANLPDRQDAVC